jgi:hypothetical protein
MNCPHCHRTLYSRRPRCEHCGETLPPEYLIPDPQEEALKAEIEESKAYLAKRRKEAAEEEEEKRRAQGYGISPFHLGPPVL